jgi:ribose/xylose/arabinose/galactoside ABC-type transport system permease subunit
VLIGPPYLLNIIAGAFIGGISLAGGEGSPYGAILGGFTVYLIENIIVILNISAFWKEVVIGLFLLFFVVFEFLRRRRAAGVVL